MPIDHDQLYEEFGLNKPKDYAERIENGKLKIENDQKRAEKPLPGSDQDGDTREKKQKQAKRPTFANLLTRFFGEAPESDKGALDW